MAAQVRARERQANFRAKLKAFELSKVDFTDERVGGGAYGYVLVVNVNGTRRAAKVLHESLVQAANREDNQRPGGSDHPRSLIESFENECTLLSEISHPNIVQFFGICYPRGATFPALVMELLMSNLYDYLQKNPPIPLSVKKSILIDISKGLVYLHAKGIIHRDLSAANVLLTVSLTAKIADLGMARIIADRHVAKMTMVPGNADYMPPEAIAGDEYSATYGKPIDSFSMGHIILFTITQKCPKLLGPKYFDRLSGKNEARSEIQRRDESIRSIHELLGEGHHLVKLATQCLQDNPQSRPSSVEIMLELQNHSLNQENAELRKGLSQHEDVIERLQKSNAKLTDDCQNLSISLEQANATLTQKVRESQRTNHQLQATSAELVDLQKEYHQMLEEKTTLTKQLYKQEQLLKVNKRLCYVGVYIIFITCIHYIIPLPICTATAAAPWEAYTNQAQYSARRTCPHFSHRTSTGTAAPGR